MTDNQTFYTPTDTVLLTGAGFTKGFGGHLASEMWAAIFSQPEIQKHNNLRNALLKSLDYEWVYDQVLFPKEKGLTFTDDEKIALVNAVHKAYEDMHRSICQDGSPIEQSSASGACSLFITRFSGRGEKRGFYFTLNQDLFTERFYSNSNQMINLPGLNAEKWFNGRLGSKLDLGDWVRLPDDVSLEKVKAASLRKGSGNFVYIKVHGSYGWKAQDGSNVMVMGRAKTEIIEREPLLRWYWDLFKSVLQRYEQKLVVVGYGFRDDHVNQVIADAINRFKLRFYVILPKEPKDFKSVLQPLDSRSFESGGIKLSLGSTLWFGMAGYYRGEVKDLYQRGTNQLTPTGEAFFRDLSL